MRLLLAGLLAAAAISAQAWNIHITPNGDRLLNRKTGENLLVVCGVQNFDGAASDVRIDWQRGGVDIKFGRKMTVPRPMGSQLMILHANKDDSGDYVCRAEIAGEVQEATVSIGFFKAPEFVNPKIHQHPEEGSDAEIECTVEGEPGFEIFWQYNGNTLDESSPRGYDFKDNGQKLIIPKFEAKKDDGHYLCNAAQFSSFETLTINVTGYSRPSITVFDAPAENAGLEGHSAEFKCGAVGKPMPTYEWFFGESETPIEQSDIYTVKDGLLVIHSLTSTDVGDYKCVATNDIGKDEKTTSLSVFLRPKVERLENHTKEEGAAVEIVCKYQGEGVTSATFVHGDKVFKVGSDDADTDDSAESSVEAETKANNNESDDEEEEAPVTEDTNDDETEKDEDDDQNNEEEETDDKEGKVDDDDDADSNDETDYGSTTAVDGEDDRVEQTTQTDADSEDTNSGENKEDDDDNVENDNTEDNDTKNDNAEDESDDSDVSNTDETLNKSLEVEDLNREEQVESQTDTNSQENENKEEEEDDMESTTQNSDDEGDGHPVVDDDAEKEEDDDEKNTLRLRREAENDRVVITNDGSKLTLRINDLKLADAGQYQCIVENKAGPVTRHSVLAITHAPYFTKTSDSSIRSFDGNELVLFCEGKAVPDPAWEWELNGDEVQADGVTVRVQSSARKSILTTSANRYGTYTCKASNGVGSPAKKEFQVIEIAVPPAPTVLNCQERVYPNYATCSLDESQYNDEKIRPTERKYEGTAFEITTAGKDQAIELTQLEPSTFYEVTITASNSVGESASLVSVFQTPDSVIPIKSGFNVIYAAIAVGLLVALLCLTGIKSPPSRTKCCGSRNVQFIAPAAGTTSFVNCLH